MNPFGDVIETYKAPVSGIINSVGTDPLREPGATIVKVNLMNTAPECKDGCWEGEP
jgi:hypothetical protein